MCGYDILTDTIILHLSPRKWQVPLLLDSLSATIEAARDTLKDAETDSVSQTPEQHLELYGMQRDRLIVLEVLYRRLAQANEEFEEVNK